MIQTPAQVVQNVVRDMNRERPNLHGDSSNTPTVLVSHKFAPVCHGGVYQRESGHTPKRWRPYKVPRQVRPAPRALLEIPQAPLTAWSHKQRGRVSKVEIVTSIALIYKV